MPKRISPHFTIDVKTRRKLIDLKDRTNVSMSRLVDESVDLYHIVRLAKRPLICIYNGTSIEISEVPQEPNHD